MALKKDIVLENGIVLNYHRVVSINNITNQQTIIEVGSYINKEQRDKERAWYESNSKDNMNVYIITTYYSKEYDKDLNVDSAYEYLKTLEVFEGAEDVFEELIETDEETMPEYQIPEESIPEEVINNEE